MVFQLAWVLVGFSAQSSELPNTFSITNPKCLEAVEAGTESSALPPVKTENVSDQQNHLVARVVKTFKKSWQQPFDMLTDGEIVKYEPNRANDLRTTEGIKIRSLESPKVNNDYAKLTHELCHAVGDKGRGYSKYGPQLERESCEIGDHGSMTPAEAERVWPNSPIGAKNVARHEHFAEVCTLFLLNPQRLKADCRGGYARMSQVFGGPSRSSCNKKRIPPVMAKSASASATSNGGAILPLGMLGVGLPLMLAQGTPQPKPIATAPSKGKLGETPQTTPPVKTPIAVSTTPRTPLLFGEK